MFTRQSVVYIGQSLSIAGQCLSMYRQDEAAARGDRSGQVRAAYLHAQHSKPWRATHL